jgi:hypothetical protein
VLQSALRLSSKSGAQLFTHVVPALALALALVLVLVLVLEGKCTLPSSSTNTSTWSVTAACV